MTSTNVIVNNPWKNEEMLKMASDQEDIGISDRAQKVARIELREEKSTREECLTNLKNWLSKNEDVSDVRSDDRFLLRFLRAKKFSIPIAQQTILKYLNFRRTFPHMSYKLDFLDPTLNSLINTGFMIPSPIRDRHGRRVVFGSARRFDPKLFTSSDMARVFFMTFEALMEDPESQVLGFTYVADLFGVVPAHITMWNPTEFAKLVKWAEQSVPIRHKAAHLVNLPSSVKWILDFAKARLSPKMKDRIFLYNSMKELHKEVEPACLPAEFGGTIPLEDMLESWKQELAAKRDLLVALDNMKILSDRGIIRSRDSNNNINYKMYAEQLESLAGSFRKLEVD